MTNEPAPIESSPPDPARDRARIEPTPSTKKTDLLPMLYLVGFVVLAGAIYFLWQNPPEARLAQQDAGKVETLQAQVVSLRDAVARLEQQKPPTPGPTVAEFQQLTAQVSSQRDAVDRLLQQKTPTTDEFQQLQTQINTLASKASPSEAEVQQLQQQVLALAAKPGVTPDQFQQLAQQVQGLAKQVPDLGPLTQRVDTLERQKPFDPASLDGKFGQLNDKVQQLASKNDEADGKLAQTVKDIQARMEDLDKQQKANAQKAQMASRLQGAMTALAAGQKLGPIAGAPPALARFATEAPPTEASLRETFDSYAASAQQASQPATSADQDFASRLWTRAQSAVTVRQGDRVLVGDPIAGVLARARAQLDGGDLAGSVATVKGLSGAPAQAMQPWLDKAQGLLDARNAIAGMVAG